MARCTALKITGQKEEIIFDNKETEPLATTTYPQSTHILQVSISNSPRLLPTSSQSHWNFLHIRKNYSQVTTVSTTQSSLLFYLLFFFAISRPSLAIRHNRENIEKIQFSYEIFNPFSAQYVTHNSNLHPSISHPQPSQLNHYFSINSRKKISLQSELQQIKTTPPKSSPNIFFFLLLFIF